MPKVIELSGIVGYDITAKGLKNRLPKDGGDVVLKVDSQGGSVFEGNRLYNAILDYSGNIEVHLGVLAASAASYFPMAAGAENIKVRANTTFMGHKAWSFAIGNADEMKAEAEILDGLDRLIAKAYSKVTGKSVDESLIDMANEFWLIGGQSVVDAGFASGVIEDDDDEEEADPIEKSEVQAMIKEAKNTLQTLEIEEDLNKWAASIKAELPENNEEPNPDISGEINKEDSSMNLTEFLDKTPEAKAEFKAAIDEGVKSALSNVGELLNLAGIAKDTVKMAVSGMSAGEFAIAEVKKQNEARAAAATNPEAPVALGNPDELPADTAPEAKNKVKGVEGKVSKEQAEVINAWDAIMDEEEAK